MLKAFIKLYKEGHRIITRNPKTGGLVFSEDKCYYAYDYSLIPCIEILRKYRDAFVHNGFALAIVHFYDLEDRMESVNALCKEVNTSVNFSNRIF